MTESTDISHLVFIDLIRNIVETSGPQAAKGSLMRIALNAGKQFPKIDFASLDDFFTALAADQTPLSKLEGRAHYLGNSLIGLKSCPFGTLTRNYRDVFAADLHSFKNLTDEFNTDSKRARELQIGLGSGVSPFCIFHQPMRNQVGAGITVSGRSLQIFQLACRNSKGEKAYADTLIEEFGCSRQDVEEAMEQYVCCYGAKVTN